MQRFSHKQPSTTNFVFESPVYQSLWIKAFTEQKYDWRDFRKVMKDHPEIYPTPFMFGCPDWAHNGDGEIDDWAHIQNPYTDEDQAAMEPPESREAQRYPANQLEDSQYNNNRHGWSGMIDQGISNDYWRERGLYYPYSREGAI